MTTHHTSALFETADLITGDIRGFLAERRAMRMPYREISEELLKLNIVVSHESVRAWWVRVQGESEICDKCGGTGRILRP